MSAKNMKSAKYYQERYHRHAEDFEAEQLLKAELSKAMNAALISVWKKTGRIFRVLVSTTGIPAFVEPDELANGMRPHKDRFTRLHPDYGHYTFDVSAGIVQDGLGFPADEKGLDEAQSFDEPHPVAKTFTDREMDMLSPEELAAIRGVYRDDVARYEAEKNHGLNHI